MDTDAVAGRLTLIFKDAVPNAFQEQRYRRGGGNVQLANDWVMDKRLPWHKACLCRWGIKKKLSRVHLLKVFNNRLSHLPGELRWGATSG